MANFHCKPHAVSSLIIHSLKCLLGILCLALASHASAERRVALVIGNAAYAQGSLKNPVNDAQDMRDALKRLGFAPADIVFRENLKLRDVGSTLREFKAKLSPDSTALVFYAGHGLQVRGENYLPAVDAQIDGEEDVPQQSLKLSTLMGVLAESKTRLNLVFLDACRNNPYQRSFRDGTRGLARSRDDTPSGTLIAYATHANDVAADGKGRNGVFTSALLQHMTLPGAPIEQVIKKVVRTVRQNTKDAQVPWSEGSLEGDFVFAPAAHSPARPPVQVATLQVEPTPLPAPRPQPPTPQPTQTIQSGQVFKGCQGAHCPEMVVIPAGSFEMGSNDGDGDEKPLHRVSIKSFSLGKYEVTQGQWKAVMGSNPSNFSSCGDTCPVERVSWDDIQQYISKLNQKTGQQYRLPSEAEWEYAARAGSSGKWSFGDNESALGQYAWLRANSGSQTHPVGQKQVNGFGLYDMHGNVWEWVQDVRHDNYQGAPTDGSAWTSAGDQSRRVLRGGSWSVSPQGLRSANRDWLTPDLRYYYYGFRLARTVP